MNTPIDTARDALVKLGAYLVSHDLTDEVINISVEVSSGTYKYQTCKATLKAEDGTEVTITLSVRS